uniref:Uncharacterized protein n=1 Tax=Cercocebus atys TaxID=9531 RepID=A0A2K5LEX5_CERAT
MLRHQKLLLFSVTLYLLITALPPYRRNGQTSESCRFLPLVTSHDLLWVNCFLYIFKHLKYSPFELCSFRWKTKQPR